MRHIIGIYDNKAQDFVGAAFMTVRHPAAAIRLFSDAATAAQGDISKHTEDYDLVQVAIIEDDDEPTRLVPSYDIIITGAQWKAAQAAQLGAPNRD